MEHSQKPIFIYGRITNLRPFSKKDIPTVTRWINDPEVRKFTSPGFPTTEEQEEAWFENLAKDQHNIVLAVETKQGELIGTMGIHKINWISRCAETGAMFGEKKYWGKGYGTDAKMHLLEYAFDTLNLHKIGSGVIAYNKRSLRYSLRCGYKIEGRRRKQLFKKGKHWDLIVLGIFREEWFRVWEKYKKTGKVR